MTNQVFDTSMAAYYNWRGPAPDSNAFHVFGNKSNSRYQAARTKWEQDKALFVARAVQPAAVLNDDLAAKWVAADNYWGGTEVGHSSLYLVRGKKSAEGSANDIHALLVFPETAMYNAELNRAVPHERVNVHAALLNPELVVINYQMDLIDAGIPVANLNPKVPGPYKKKNDELIKNAANATDEGMFDPAIELPTNEGPTG